MGEWDNYLQEYCCDESQCSAAALAGEDGAFYAAAPTADDAGWGIVFADDHEQDILQDDGETTKKKTINEATTLLAAIKDKKTPADGLWLGQIKYKVVRSDEKEDLGDQYECFWMTAVAPKKGVHIFKTTSQILVVFYDEEKGQQSGNCKNCGIAFAKYLMENSM